MKNYTFSCLLFCLVFGASAFSMQANQGNPGKKIKYSIKFVNTTCSINRITIPLMLGYNKNNDNNVYTKLLENIVLTHNSTYGPVRLRAEIPAEATQFFFYGDLSGSTTENKYPYFCQKDANRLTKIRTSEIRNDIEYQLSIHCSAHQESPGSVIYDKVYFYIE